MILCDLYTYCWIWFTSILLKILASIIHQGYWFIASVCVCVCVCTILVWFWCQGNAGFITCIWKVFFLSYFWKSLRISIKSYLSILQSTPVKPSGTWAFVCQEIFDYCFILLSSIWSIQIFNFFMIYLGRFVSRTSSISSQLSYSLPCNSSSLMIIYISIVSE